MNKPIAKPLLMERLELSRRHEWRVLTPRVKRILSMTFDGFDFSKLEEGCSKSVAQCEPWRTREEIQSAVQKILTQPEVRVCIDLFFGRP